MRGEWTLTSEGVAAVQSIRSCGSVPRSVDDPRERESAPCGAPTAPEEFEPGELPRRTPDGDAEPPRSIRRGTSMDRPSRVSTRRAPSDSLVAAASPSIPPRCGPHRLQCVTRRSVTRCRAGSHVFPSQRPGRPVIAPTWARPSHPRRMCDERALKIRRPCLRPTRVRPRECPASTASHSAKVGVYAFESSPRAGSDFRRHFFLSVIQSTPAKPNASVRSN